MPGWEPLRGLAWNEIRQRTEEGYDTAGLAEKISDVPDEGLNAFYEEILARPKCPDFPYVEPNDWESIRKDAPVGDAAEPQAIPEDLLLKKLHGAWVGRACGCALGKPVESGPFMNGRNGVEGWKNVKAWFEGADAYPITYYTPEHSRAEEKGLDLARHCKKSMREYIRFMESDDDVRYTVLGLLMMESRGKDWNSWDLGKLWHGKLAYAQVCTSETQAYLNFGQVTDHLHRECPDDFRERLEWVRTWHNPYREWIGAQIRVDAYGYCAAGDPAVAAKLAFEDASFSAVKNGIYGAMFCAAMIAAAFTAKTPEEIVKAGMDQIPKSSRLYAELVKTIELVKNEPDEEKIIQALWDNFRGMNGVHTINNACMCAAAILHSAGDYEKAITMAVLGGWDTDCNGATVGSIMGAFLGRDGIPEKWAEPLHDTMYAEVPGFDPIMFTDAAKRCLAVYKKIARV